MKPQVVDLFCGIGGLSYGLLCEGFDIRAGYDLDARCDYAFSSNTGGQFFSRDVAELTGRELVRHYHPGAVRILAGCAPCQPFSLYRNGKPRSSDWQLVNRMGALVLDARPHIITMENVPQLTHHHTFRKLVRSLESAGYGVTWYIAKGPDYGLPQKRNRLLLFGSLAGYIELVEPTHSRSTSPTVRDVMGRLTPIAAGEAGKGDRLHMARNLSEINLQRIQTTPEGGWWRDWDPELQLACHQTDRGASYRTVYGRMRWDDQAPTITTQCLGLGNGQFGHPEQDRAISIREAALLQTFPRSYKLVKRDAVVHSSTLALQLGNAVPPRLGRIIGRSIRRHLRMIGA